MMDCIKAIVAKSFRFTPLNFYSASLHKILIGVATIGAYHPSIGVMLFFIFWSCVKQKNIKKEVKKRNDNK